MQSLIAHVEWVKRFRTSPQKKASARVEFRSVIAIRLSSMETDRLNGVVESTDLGNSPTSVFCTMNIAILRVDVMEAPVVSMNY